MQRAQRLRNLKSFTYGRMRWALPVLGGVLNQIILQGWVLVDIGGCLLQQNNSRELLLSRVTRNVFLGEDLSSAAILRGKRERDVGKICDKWQNLDAYRRTRRQRR